MPTLTPRSDALRDDVATMRQRYAAGDPDRPYTMMVGEDMHLDFLSGVAAHAAKMLDHNISPADVLDTACQAIGSGVLTLVQLIGGVDRTADTFQSFMVRMQIEALVALGRDPELVRKIKLQREGRT